MPSDRLGSSLSSANEGAPCGPNDMMCNLSNFMRSGEFGNLTDLIEALTAFNRPEGKDIQRDDAAWILANAFLILTMQTGFGMLEAGSVSSKNIANIMVKNVVDVSIGGITYWSVGYALSFGRHNWGGFCGYGDFFVTADTNDLWGSVYSKYVFQFSFATAATTIVSGAVAERMRLQAYMVYSCLNVFIYCLPASWVWNEAGFLKNMKFFDFAGAAVVHLSGGTSALVAAWLLGPRIGRFEKNGKRPAMSSPVTSLTGTFMLWWAWLAFNCGSSFGLTGDLWKIAAKAGICTLNGSIGGSLMGLILSVATTWQKGSYYFDISTIINSVLGGLIGVTACCAVITPAESILIGAIGGTIATFCVPLLEKLKIDDPVGAISVHMGSATWSVLSVGLFANDDFDLLGGTSGLFRGGGIRLFATQTLGVLIIAAWSMGMTLLILLGLKATIGIRMAEEEEILGADWVEHRIRSEKLTEDLEEVLRNVNASNPERLNEIITKVIERVVTDDTVRSDIVSRIIHFCPPDGSRRAATPIITSTMELLKRTPIALNKGSGRNSVSPADKVKKLGVITENVQELEEVGIGEEFDETKTANSRNENDINN